MAIYLPVMGNITSGDWFRVIAHGFAMDCSMAAYFTIFPAILTVVSIWSTSNILKIIDRAYIAISAAIISIIAVVDMSLYGYWNFRLDTTPFFYFFSSPSSALASISAWTALLAVVIIITIAFALFFIISKTADKVTFSADKSISSTIIGIVATASLIIPIRGSFTVSTMNLSRAYFSNNQRLNHAAINPAFSLMYSATHQSDFSSQFRYFNADEAAEIFDKSYSKNGCFTDSVEPLFTTERPDIYIIILESFSKHLLPSLGGEPIANGLDSIARSGLLFSNFYASGARTDRAIPAILSAFPAQPTTSLMKFAKKIEKVESLPRTLADSASYEMSYYYGGDANFTNMLAYLVSSGFSHIISDKDFPSSQLTGKWGAHDDAVFNRALDDIKAKSDMSVQPQLTVIQTSSSHEPFEVPYSDLRFADNPRKNAFAFADQSLKTFIDSLSSMPEWDKSVVIITADHYGAYPEHIDNPLERHHIPLVITGGALNRKTAVIDTPSDQTAITATILSAMNISSSRFKYSQNLFDDESFAFFTEPGIAAYVSETDTTVINTDSDTPIIVSGSNPESAIKRCKAILQTIYTDLSNL